MRNSDGMGSQAAWTTASWQRSIAGARAKVLASNRQKAVTTAGLRPFGQVSEA